MLPEIENAILAGHHMVFLGERGQAKTRIIRGLVALLDQVVPAIAGCEINDDPFAPDLRSLPPAQRASRATRSPIAWIGRDAALRREARHARTCRSPT